ncbi:hypothetical protein Q3O60_05215 [Alkalimonas collagenimarina]|uniref:Lipoprotein n=1 Tax=Alkalimonas collagenimarina TaxID=400390 RepID=A0ABT9GWY9_9GAMM|nr:hypothetical protein [Alkalimonas collagenimarina]MDP4535578.1 hypothetical protein [Alkalimonas collagenimarina]
MFLVSLADCQAGYPDYLVFQVVGQVGYPDYQAYSYYRSSLV